MLMFPDSGQQSPITRRQHNKANEQREQGARY
jgi:hypothetical protein